MINITLPDGSVRRYDKPVTGADVAADIGPGLAKAALAVKINGDMKDLLLPITEATRGHGTHSLPEIWGGELVTFLKQIE